MVAAAAYTNIHDGRAADRSINTASGPPGIGIIAESSNEIANRPKTPYVTRYWETDVRPFVILRKSHFKTDYYSLQKHLSHLKITYQKSIAVFCPGNRRPTVRRFETFVTTTHEQIYSQTY